MGLLFPLNSSIQFLCPHTSHHNCRPYAPALLLTIDAILPSLCLVFSQGQLLDFIPLCNCPVFGALHMDKIKIENKLLRCCESILYFRRCCYFPAVHYFRRCSATKLHTTRQELVFCLMLLFSFLPNKISCDGL